MRRRRRAEHVVSFRRLLQHWVRLFLRHEGYQTRREQAQITDRLATGVLIQCRFHRGRHHPRALLPRPWNPSINPWARTIVFGLTKERLRSSASAHNRQSVERSVILPIFPRPARLPNRSTSECLHTFPPPPSASTPESNGTACIFVFRPWLVSAFATCSLGACKHALDWTVRYSEREEKEKGHGGRKRFAACSRRVSLWPRPSGEKDKEVARIIWCLHHFILFQQSCRQFFTV
ncbi:hypothetical protein LX36DRAFT_358090 [Colletotrichum falcatum]|nr:hypothetical protein LX36DRAFT_358090 [Colletotrichum falcatum]